MGEEAHTSLQFTTLTLPAAGFSPEGNALPPLTGLRTSHWPVVLDASVVEEDRAWFNHSCDISCLPYPIQDKYDRKPAPREFKVAVLENDHLKAVFLLEFGARLWSLVEKRSGRNLVHTHPVFQPGNLATRGAWFAGGVEWNVSVVGHSPFTCECPFVGRFTDEDGNACLRVYEWERIRGIPFQIDFHLPPDSTFLQVAVTLRNPHMQAVPMYWWSNIAIPETDRTRVLAPADRAFQLSYESGRRTARMVPAPIYEGRDTSYPANQESARDFFYRLSTNLYPWQAVVDDRGRGMVHCSTGRLKSRKLFSWGRGPGGRRWQEFLAHAPVRYAEAQAGLTWTQAECVDMPPETTWQWVETYGAFELDPAIAHGDWNTAREAVEANLQDRLSPDELDAAYRSTSRLADVEVEALYQEGSGWGALERRRCESTGAPFASTPALKFDDDTLSTAQAPWLALLETGQFPETPPEREPGAFMLQNEWRQLLEAAFESGRSHHWLACYHLGLMAYGHGEKEGALSHWRQSHALRDNAWARRNIALLAIQDGNWSEAYGEYSQAWRLAPGSEDLAVEFSTLHYEHGALEAQQAFLDSLDPGMTTHPRIQLLRAKVTLREGHLESAEKQILELEIPDLRENSNLLTELWYQLKEQQARAAGKPFKREQWTPPPHIDFRMSARARVS